MSSRVIFVAELPNPVHIHFADQKLRVIVWYDYAGHFTNKVYIFSSVDDMGDENNTKSVCLEPSPMALSHIAHLRFPEVCLLVGSNQVRLMQPPHCSANH